MSSAFSFVAEIQLGLSSSSISSGLSSTCSSRRRGMSFSSLISLCIFDCCLSSRISRRAVYKLVCQESSELFL